MITSNESSSIYTDRNRLSAATQQYNEIISNNNNKMRGNNNNNDDLPFSRRIEHIRVSDFSSASSNKIIRLSAKGINLISAKESSLQKRKLMKLNDKSQDKKKNSNTNELPSINKIEAKGNYFTSKGTDENYFKKEIENMVAYLQNRIRQYEKSQVLEKQEILRLKGILEQNQLKIAAQAVYIDKIGYKMERKIIQNKQKLESNHKKIENLDQFHQHSHMYTIWRMEDIEIRLKMIVSSLDQFMENTVKDCLNVEIKEIIINVLGCLYTNNQQFTYIYQKQFKKYSKLVDKVQQRMKQLNLQKFSGIAIQSEWQLLKKLMQKIKINLNKQNVINEVEVVNEIHNFTKNENIKQMQQISNKIHDILISLQIAQKYRNDLSEHISEQQDESRQVISELSSIINTLQQQKVQLTLEFNKEYKKIEQMKQMQQFLCKDSLILKQQVEISKNRIQQLLVTNDRLKKQIQKYNQNKKQCQLFIQKSCQTFQIKQQQEEIKLQSSLLEINFDSLKNQMKQKNAELIQSNKQILQINNQLSQEKEDMSRLEKQKIKLIEQKKQIKEIYRQIEQDNYQLMRKTQKLEKIIYELQIQNENLLNSIQQCNVTFQKQSETFKGAIERLKRQNEDLLIEISKKNQLNCKSLMSSSQKNATSTVVMVSQNSQRRQQQKDSNYLTLFGQKLGRVNSERNLNYKNKPMNGQTIPQKIINLQIAIIWNKYKLPLKSQIDQTGYLKNKQLGIYIVDECQNLFELSKKQIEIAVKIGLILIQK